MTTEDKERIKRLEDSMQQVNLALSSMMANQILMSERMEATFQRIETRFEAIDTRFEAIDARFEAISAKLNAVACKRSGRSALRLPHSSHSQIHSRYRNFSRPFPERPGSSVEGRRNAVCSAR